MARFATTFSVARSEVMKLSKVKSKSTYSKCLNELKDWGYIVYQPSNNPFKGSVFSLSNNWTTSGPPFTGASPINGPLLPESSPNNGPPLVPYKTYKLNIININGAPENENNVIEFFLTEKSTKKEAQKFWNYYQSNGWKVGGKTPVKNWGALARKWMLSQSEKTKKGVVQKMDYLHTNNNKRYDEPL